MMLELKRMERIQSRKKRMYKRYYDYIENNKISRPVNIEYPYPHEPKRPNTILGSIASVVNKKLHEEQKPNPFQREGPTEFQKSMDKPNPWHGKQGSISIITVIFSVLVFGIIWFIFLGGWLNDSIAYSLSTQNITGIEAFIISNLNMFIFLALFLFIVAVGYIAQST